MGANQSADQQPLPADATGRPAGITVVNPTPGNQQDREVVLPARVPPILSIEGNQIDTNRHRPNVDQLNSQLWAEFIKEMSEFADSRAQFVATRQGRLQDKIAQIDAHVHKFTDSYVNGGKHRAFKSLNEDYKKTDDIDRLVQKCTLQSELCVSMLNKLNFLLPDDHKLEPLEP